jgi:hypothetical protein
MLFPDIVRELAQGNKLDDTMRLLGQMGDPSVTGGAWDIFHSIPRSVLQSIVLGTVAYDDSNAMPLGPLDSLSDDGPGVYVLGLSIAGRMGEFLDLNELDRLLINLRTYIKGCRYLAENDKTHPKPGSAADLVSKVDSAYGTHMEPGKPRFCEGNFNTAWRLYNSLRRRYRALKAVDPASTTRMIQSPLYVGSDKHVGRRIAAYELVHTKTALQRANKLYGLTVSLLHYQGLTPKVHIITAVRTWQSGQLSRAEMLVAALAGSYDSLDGFNVREAGQTSDDLPLDSWLDHEVYVFSTMPHFCRNIDWSIADIDRLAKIRESPDYMVSRVPCWMRRLRSCQAPSSSLA